MKKQKKEAQQAGPADWPPVHPYLNLRAGRSRDTWENLGPFTLHVSNKTNYCLYEVKVTGDVTVLKQASRPSLTEVFAGLSRAVESKQVPLDVYRDYQQRTQQGAP